MSSSRFCFFTQTVGYASLALNDSGLVRLQKYFQKVPFETEIAAEGVHPNWVCRPIWSQILELIGHKAITTLVVPSLEHIAGEDYTALADVLKLLRLKGVRLRSLAEWIDNSRQSDSQILAGFVKKSFGGNNAAIDRKWGAQ
jgi:DNA invertase Pin-like site-specific DNA recombinase